MARAFVLGFAYFGVVFAIGFAFGVVRLLYVAPQIGAIWAVSAEAPLMLAASAVVCRWLLRGQAIGHGFAGVMGITALTLLLLAEAGLSLAAGRSLGGHLALYAELPHQIGLAAQIGFALLPQLFARPSPTSA